MIASGRAVPGVDAVCDDAKLIASVPAAERDGYR